MDYQEYRLKSICDIKSGKRIPKGMDFTNEITKYPYIRARDIKGGKIKTDDLIYIDETVHKKIKKYIINSGDIAITIVGASIGDVSYAQKEVDGYNLTENAVRLTSFTKDVNGKYLFYVLSQKQYNEYMQCVAGGAAQPKLGIYKIEPMKVLLPSIDLQNRVVDILSVYDEVIEINNKRIKILEQMAENIYKEWFVRFRFPGHENAEFVDGIPKGWKKMNLFDVASVCYGYTFSSDLFCDDKSLYPVVRIRDIVNNYTNTFTSEECDKKYIIENNSILVGMDGIFHTRLWTGGRAFLNQRVVKLNSRIDKLSNYQLYHAICPQIKFWEQAILGTTVAHLGDKHLKKMSIVMPDERALNKAFDVFENLLEQQLTLHRQNQNLIKQRDLLLPRLMSGKLEIE